MLVALLPRRKTDIVAIGCAVAAIVAVLVNALVLQARPDHLRGADPKSSRATSVVRTVTPAPAPALPAARPMPVAPVARPAPAITPAVAPTPPPAPARKPEPAPRPRAEIVTDIQRELTERGYYDGAVDGLLGPRTDQAMKQLIEQQGLKVAAAPTESLLAEIRKAPARDEVTAALPPIDPTSTAARILSVQRMLNRFGYGPLKLNALHDRDTRAAIERFERDRNLPSSGEVNERLMRELTTFSGVALQ
jgi:hypothetical protein